MSLQSEFEEGCVCTACSRTTFGFCPGDPLHLLAAHAHALRRRMTPNYVTLISLKREMS